MEWVSKKRKTAIDKAHNYGILQRRLDIINMNFLRSHFLNIDEYCHAMKMWDAEFYPLSNSSRATVASACRIIDL